MKMDLEHDDSDVPPSVMITSARRKRKWNSSLMMTDI